MVYWHGIDGGWMIFGAVMMVIFWAGIIWAVAWVIRRTVNHIYHGENMTPLDIVKARYARGEITKDQFDQLKKDL